MSSTPSSRSIAWLGFACWLIGAPCVPVIGSSMALAADPAPPAKPADAEKKPKGLERIPGPLPTKPQDILMLVDTLVRAGAIPEARILLKQVAEMGPPWAPWGEVGLGFLDLARGRFDDARPHFATASTTDFAADVSLVLLAMLDGQAGNVTQAAAVLDGIAVKGTARPAVQQAAQLGAGYVRYWAGAYEEAALAFDALSTRFPDSPFADDALYALAQSFVMLGDRASAEDMLDQISRMPARGWDDGHVRPALRQLSFREILRATTQRYQNVPLGQPDQMLVALLDVNGRVLASGRLRGLQKERAGRALGVTLGQKAAADAAEVARRSGGAHAGTEMAMGSSPSTTVVSPTEPVPSTVAPTPDTNPAPTTPEPTLPPAADGAAEQPPAPDRSEPPAENPLPAILLLAALIGGFVAWRRRRQRARAVSTQPIDASQPPAHDSTETPQPS